MAVAYYFFQKDNKDERSVNKALRAVIWQLTQRDAVYQKSVAGACDKPEEFGNTLELWRQLIVQFSTKIEVTIFIILDGIDEAKAETGDPLIQILREVSLFAAEKRPLSLRLLITGRPMSFLEINKTPNIAMSTIQLGTRNTEDILKFVELRLDTMEIFKKSDQPDIQELKERIRTELTHGAQGESFLNVRLVRFLTEISKKRRRKEIEEVLEHADEDRQATIAREIERLRQALGDEDIEDLNEVLIWVIGAMVWPLLTTLESALFIKNGESSLTPLENQVREKYSALLEVSEYQTLAVTSQSIIEYFRAKAQQAAEDKATHTALHESEIAIVKRFLRNFCDDELFNKFGFEEFFQEKLSHRNTSIHADLDNMDLHILLSLLKAICGELRSEVFTLIEYTCYWLPDHLTEVDLHHQALRAPLALNLLNYSRRKNMLTGGGRKTACGCGLGLTVEQREWVNGLNSSSRPNDDLLKPIAKIMAKRWLQVCGLWFVEDIYWWLLGCVTKVKERTGEGERVTSDVSPTLEQILEVEKWAMKELGVTEQDSLWTVRMAITFRHYGFYQQAIERSTISKNLDSSSNWRAPFCLAQTHALQGRYKMALETLEEVIAMFRKNGDIMEEWCAAFYSDILYYLREWNVELQEYEAANAHNPDSYEPILRIILILEAQEKYGEIIEYSKLYHETITKAGRAAGQLEAVKETYQVAIEAAKSGETRLTTLTALRYWYPLFLYYDYPHHNAHEEAITIWEQNVASIPRISNELISNVRWSTVAKLATSYIQEAREAGLDTPYCRYIPQQVDLSLHKQQRWSWLCICLSHIENDVNTLAAWSLLGPTIDREATSDCQEIGEETFSEAGGSESEAAAAEEDESSEVLSQTDAGDEEEGEDGQSANVSETSPSPSENGYGGGLDGHLAFICDGGCGHEWSYADDVYPCKDFIDVQFDTACYEKLTAGTLGQKVDTSSTYCQGGGLLAQLGLATSYLTVPVEASTEKLAYKRLDSSIFLEESDGRLMTMNPSRSLAGRILTSNPV
uniref:Nephrocystin 3-like N-terminal domain-containing protein n=1 Tax=Coccidioides posadasii RMSCC 3488 TaxID=454284 RepID=A0A0J6F4W7_COCPO|nr:hypothetical protein CPAG_04294 [Coccidioides posadasii RMSCC 3488]